MAQSQRQICADRARPVGAGFAGFARMDAAYAAGDRRIPRMGLALGRAPVGDGWRRRRCAELADGRIAHESCDRIADRCRVRHIRPGIGGRHGVAQHRAAIHVGGGGRCADLYTDRADRIDAVRAVRRLGGGDCGRMRIRLRTESGAYRKTCGRTRRAFAVC